MGSRRQNKGTDKLLQNRHWRDTIRGHWVRVRLPCARCGGLVDYDAPRYFPGTTKVNPRTLNVGHIVGRDEARLRGWTDIQINDLSNTQPEHARCSDVSGAQYGNAKRGLGTGLTSVSIEPAIMDQSREW